MSAPPDRGAVMIEVPDGTRTVARWRVRVGETSGTPGVPLEALAGPCRVTIEAELWTARLRLAARLEQTVPVLAGRLTRLRLPLPELPLRVAALFRDREAAAAAAPPAAARHQAPTGAQRADRQPRRLGLRGKDLAARPWRIWAP